VKLSGDETRLALHPNRIVGPGYQQLVGLLRPDGELVDQNNRTAGVPKLIADRDPLIHFDISTRNTHHLSPSV
jgi:hypothetical protein